MVFRMSRGMRSFAGKISEHIHGFRRQRRVLDLEHFLRPQSFLFVHQRLIDFQYDSRIKLHKRDPAQVCRALLCGGD